MRVLVVGTYRDTDITRKSAFQRALATLTRDPGFERIVLRGLSKPEVRAYIAAAAHLEPSAGVLERIFEETEGNPFFLAEVVNLLTQEGSLGRDSVTDIAMPDGVREALGRRLDRISAETNELLQVAAVVGREFAYDTLTLLGDRGSDELLKLIEEAVEARVIEEMEQPGRYRFTHALMQETLLGELSTTRRVRLQGRWGRHSRSAGVTARTNSPAGWPFISAKAHTHSGARRARLPIFQVGWRTGGSQNAWDEAIRCTNEVDP